MKNIPLLLFGVLLLSGSHTFGKGHEALTDLPAAIELATKEQKSLFVIYGRQACGNCQALHQLLERNDVRVPKTAFIIVDINCDDPAVSRAFESRYKIEGNTLPFVVIAKSDGSQVASRSGYGTAAEFNKFVSDARRNLK